VSGLGRVSGTECLNARCYWCWD